MCAVAFELVARDERLKALLSRLWYLTKFNTSIGT